ncbi:MAG: D-amino-acid transaminase [Nitrospiria bacterium]
MPDIYFLNNQFLKLQDAKISINDRGFQFGDGVYEVVRTYRRKIFHLESHLVRFERSAAGLQIPMPFSTFELKAKIEEAFEMSGYSDAKIYMQLTRGTAERGHAFPPGLIPTFLITVLELHSFPADLKQHGVGMITTEDIRWGRCDIKSINLLPNVLAQQRAKSAGVYEALMVRDGVVTEGSISNFFMIKQMSLCTPPLNQNILPGVTRDVILKLARDLKISILEKNILVSEIYEADEVFLSGTTVEIVPVVKIDGRAIGEGSPGPLTQRLMKEFQIYTKIA